MPTLFHRLFFAVQPDMVTARQTHAFVEPFAEGAAMLPPERLHMTLAITPDYPDFPRHAADTLRTIGDTILGEPFDVQLDRLVASRTSVALRPARRVGELSALAALLDRAMTSAGLCRPEYRFSPHQTAFYRQGEPWHRAVTGFVWHVREFVLIHSEYGRGRHHVLGRWPLIAQPRLL